MALSRLSSIRRLIRRVVLIEEQEIASVLWSALYFFSLLAGYYILRPIRDEMAVAGGVENLPWLYAGTLVTVLLVNPVFAVLVSRLPRRRFVRIVYRFFSLNLLIFFLLFHRMSQGQEVWLGRAFFVWTSVFNLFVVSIFWAVMADTYTRAQGKRLFGFIALGGTLGGIAGSALTSVLVRSVGAVSLMLIAILFIEQGVRCLDRLSRYCRLDSLSQLSSSEPIEVIDAAPSAVPSSHEVRDSYEQPIGGKSLSGFANCLQSPYLRGITMYMLLFTITSTFLYFQQAEIVGSAFADRTERTAVFAQIDLAVNLLTILVQLFLTSRFIRRFGVGLTLASLPGLTLVGFISLGFLPSLSVIVVFQTLRRAGNFALVRPAREVLFTVLKREDKFKAKALIDTFVYRAGDQIGAWSFAGLTTLGLTLSGVAIFAVPVSALWGAVGLWLGGEQAKRRH